LRDGEALAKHGRAILVPTMSTPSTEAVVRNHLDAFVTRKGVAALLADYDDDARLHTEVDVYRGKKEIEGFFVAFIGSLPAGAIDRFSLRTLRTDGNLAYITWSAGEEIPLGTDTFVVRNGKIVSQTVAMYARRPEDAVR
jgi:hypothetical protein